MADEKFFESPFDIVNAYETGFVGAYKDADAEARLKDEIRAQGGIPEGVMACSQFGLEETGKDKLSLPVMEVLKLYPDSLPGGAQGRGDCFVPGTMVLMADGTEKPIEHVRVGEEVISHLGVRRKVIDVIEKPYAGEIVELQAKGHVRGISATPDHRFVTFPALSATASARRHKTLETLQAQIWRPVGELQAKDFVLLPAMESAELETVFDLAACPVAVTAEHKHNAAAVGAAVGPDWRGQYRLDRPAENAVRPKHGRRGTEARRFVSLDEDLAWLLGIYLAEGSCDMSAETGMPKRLTFNLAAHERGLAERIQATIARVFGCDARITQVPSKPTVLYVRLSNSVVAWFITDLCRGNQWSKQVPPCVYQATRAARLAFLRGWLAGDGHFQARRGPSFTAYKVTGVSVSAALVRGMFNVALSLGLKASVTKRGARGRSKEAFDLHLYDWSVAFVYPERVIWSQVRASRSNWRCAPNGLAVKLTAVTRQAYTGPVYCLGVETDHSFVANGFAVHNCVSWNARNGGLITMCCDIASEVPDEVSGKLEGAPEISDEARLSGVLSTEAIYNWRRHGGDGWSSAEAVQVMMKDSGLWLRKKYDEINVDFTRYSARNAGIYGSRTPPDSWRKIGADHLIRTATELSSFEEVRDMLANGYGILTDGGESWSDQRDANGVAKRTAKGWSHAMALGGVDDRPEIKKLYNEPLVLVLQSWGEWNEGPRTIFGTNLLIPVGAFWVRWSEFKRRYMVAVSGVNGWPRKKLASYGALGNI